MAARRAHNPEAAGSSPAPAIEGICFLTGVFFVLKEICILTVQDSKRSERRPNKEEEATGRPLAESVDAVEGADRKSATVTASPAPAIEENFSFDAEVFLF